MKLKNYRDSVTGTTLDMNRDQENQEILHLVLEIMAVEGQITEKEKSLIKRCDGYGEAIELAKGLRRRRKKE